MSLQIVFIANFLVLLFMAWFFIFGGKNAQTQLIEVIPLILAIVNLFAYLGMAFPNVNWY